MTTSRPTAIVTGGKQGLGHGAAVALAKRGFNLAIADLEPSTDIDPAVLASVRDAGVDAEYFTLDIADLAAHGTFLDAVEQRFGRWDCLVNNAGIATRPLTDVLDLTPDAFDHSVDINLRGTFFLTQAFAHRLLAAPKIDNAYRSIIIVSSIAAEMVNTDRPQYCITKSALTMVTKLFAQRLGREGIFVHEIRPGFMKTAMIASAGNTPVDEWISDGRVPIPRWGQPDDVGNAIATLAAGDMPYMTGQPLWIAGGLNMSPAP